MAWQDRASNAGLGAFQGAATGASIGAFAGPKGALIGGAIGGAFGLLQGLLSDTEMQELARRYARGEISPEQEQAIVSALATRYDQIRETQGADLARRGMLESSMAGRVMAETYQNEQDALAQALVNASMQRQQMGMEMLAQQQGLQQQGYAAAANVLGTLALEHWRSQRNPTGGFGAGYQQYEKGIIDDPLGRDYSMPVVSMPSQGRHQITSSSGGGHPLVNATGAGRKRSMTINNPGRGLWKPSAVNSALA